VGQARKPSTGIMPYRLHVARAGQAQGFERASDCPPNTKIDKGMDAKNRTTLEPHDRLKFEKSTGKRAVNR
jgi:hypothetical protein